MRLSLGIKVILILAVVPLVNSTITYTGRSPGIEGYVVDQDNEPVSGAIIYIADPLTYYISNDAGHFVLWGVSKGIYDVTVNKEGYGDLVLYNQIVTGEERENLGKLRIIKGVEGETGTIYGQVFNEQGEPVRDANIEIWATSVETDTNEAGKFILEGVPVGRRIVEVWAKGYKRLKTSTEVEVGETIVPVITLEPGYSGPTW